MSGPGVPVSARASAYADLWATKMQSTLASSEHVADTATVAVAALIVAPCQEDNSDSALSMPYRFFMPVLF